MTIQDDIRRIESLAARIKPPAGLRPVLSLHPSAGEVWTTSFKDKDGESYRMLVLHGPIESTTGVYQVAPLHRRIEYTGPDDVILPREVFGHRVVACVGASIPVERSSLVACQGGIPEQWLALLRNYAAWLDGSSEVRPNVLSGLHYLDNQDRRWVFKEALGRTLMAYQAFPGEEESLAISGSMIQFPVFEREEEELALAADSSISAQRSLRSYKVVTGGGVCLRVSDAEDPDFVAIEIVRDERDELAGAVVKDDAGEALAKFEASTVYFRLPPSRSFKICTPESPDGIALLPESGIRENDDRP